MEHYIIKASGERQLFSEAKLRSALEHAMVAPDLVGSIVARVRAELHDGMTTSQIYALAFSFLREQSHPKTQWYGLRQAIMELGPDGHAFEKLVGEILETEGYRVKTGQVVQGACVTHEVDVVADNGVERILVECKFHNDQSIKSDVKVALYVQARFEDIKKRAVREGLNEFHATWLVTNTKLSEDAVRYSRCVGMQAIGWGYPEEGNLEQLIERAGLHPVTSLTTLGAREKRELLNIGIVTCRSLAKDPTSLARIGMGEAQVSAVMGEVKELCGETV